MNSINEKQKAFCRALITNKFNQTKAYMEAYPDSKATSARGDACKLLANPSIGEYLQTLVEKHEEEDLVTVREVIEGIKKDVDLASLDAQYSASLKGRELLGKYKAMWVDRKESSIALDVKSPLADAIKELRNGNSKPETD